MTKLYGTITLDPDPELRGLQVGALCNALRDRIIKLTKNLSPLSPAVDVDMDITEIRALLAIYQATRLD